MPPFSGTASSIFQRAALAHNQGRLGEAERLYQAVLLADDRHFASLCGLGVLRLQQRHFGDAERVFRRAVKADRRSAEAHQYLGFALTALDQFDDAVRSYERAITLRPGFAEAHNNLGYALQRAGRLDQAVTHFNRAIAIRADYPEAHNNLGNALHLLDRSEEAAVHYRHALGIKPDYAEAWWNLGAAQRATGAAQQAVASYERAIAIKPDYHEAHNSLGNTLRETGQIEAAIAHYEKAIAVKPDYIEAHLNLGDALAALRCDEAAVAAYDSALAVKLDNAAALTKRAESLARLNREAEALAGFEAALAADPTHDLAFDGLARSLLAICDWTRGEALQRQMLDHVAMGRLFNAFNFLAFNGDPALQLACAKRFARHEVPRRPPRLWTGSRWCHDRIKVAYVACGFHRHPTAYLTAELIEIHDRSLFEIIGVSLGPDDGSDIRARLVCAFDGFYDMRDKGDREVAELMHDMQIDIAVDRSGYTTNARPAIFAFRPAPIQVNYIGFPGTLGSDAYDYIIGDATVLPFDQHPLYTEKIVQLPDSYLVNDSKRPRATRIPTRREAGLPENGFVFCCFNNCYKITPEIFDAWMRLLAQTRDSVFWLFSESTTAKANLCREAQARGIDASRLVFARRTSQEQHIARHRLADLFLDTLPYNAHTTAADALWSGVPVVTCIGRSFAGRVAASLLGAIGLPELITSDLQSYEELALRLASDPDALAELRARLSRNRSIFPLFDTDRYRRHIEAAYVQMWTTWQEGKPPASFAVGPDGGIIG
jgi:protein O-GlcNAc transferase